MTNHPKSSITQHEEGHTPQPAGEWQPIVSAPKDGTAVLGYFPSRRGYVARQDCIPIFWCSWGDGIWQNSTSGHNIVATEPSHWMPLPAPPDAPIVQGEGDAQPRVGYDDPPKYRPLTTDDVLRHTAPPSPVIDEKDAEVEAQRGISWDALLTVLDRLKSKNRNPERDWYLGWNSALDCLINDVKARARKPTSDQLSDDIDQHGRRIPFDAPAAKAEPITEVDKFPTWIQSVAHKFVKGWLWHTPEFDQERARLALCQTIAATVPAIEAEPLDEESPNG